LHSINPTGISHLFIAKPCDLIWAVKVPSIWERARLSNKNPNFFGSFPNEVKHSGCNYVADVRKVHNGFSNKTETSAIVPKAFPSLEKRDFR